MGMKSAALQTKEQDFVFQDLTMQNNLIVFKNCADAF
jgi:hypothetical protein